MTDDNQQTGSTHDDQDTSIDDEIKADEEADNVSYSDDSGAGDDTSGDDSSTDGSASDDSGDDSSSDDSAGDDSAKIPQEILDKFTIPKKVIEKYAHIVNLVIETQSMNDDERQYWFQILPIMSNEQVEKFQSILITEKEQLAKLDREYEEELEKLNQKHLLEWKEYESREKRKKRKEQEEKEQVEEEAHEEELLNKLDEVDEGGL
jgi:hypothetical protein